MEKVRGWKVDVGERVRGKTNVSVKHILILNLFLQKNIDTLIKEKLNHLGL